MELILCCHIGLTPEWKLFETIYPVYVGAIKGFLVFQCTFQTSAWPPVKSHIMMPIPPWNVHVGISYATCSNAPNTSEVTTNTTETVGFNDRKAIDNIQSIMKYLYTSYSIRNPRYSNPIREHVHVNPCKGAATSSEQLAG